MAERYGAEMTIPDWQLALRAQPAAAGGLISW
jgi:hypothetical protein